MNINISCEQCGDNLEIVREWSERGDIEITVLPCGCCPNKKPDSYQAQTYEKGALYFERGQHVKITQAEDSRIS